MFRGGEAVFPFAVSFSFVGSRSVTNIGGRRCPLRTSRVKRPLFEKLVMPHSYAKVLPRTLHTARWRALLHLLFDAGNTVGDSEKGTQHNPFLSKCRRK